MDRYKRNQDILKTAAPGSPEYTKAYEGLKRVGEMYGLNWQQHVKQGAPPPAAAEAAPTFAPPTNLPPEFTAEAPKAPPIVGPGPTPPGEEPPPPGEEPPPPGEPDFETLIAEGLGGLSSSMGFIKDQGAFQPGDFTGQMEKARQTVMGQFERRTQEEFGRQNLATQQAIVERGLDPNSEAAQALMKANTQRQDLARQEAMSAAEQAAQGVQAQAYGQAAQTWGMPFQAMQAYMPFYQGQMGQISQQTEAANRERQMALEAGYGQMSQQRAAEIESVLRAKNFEYEKQLRERGYTADAASLKAKAEYDKALVKLQARLRPPSGGGGANANPYESALDKLFLAELEKQKGQGQGQTPGQAAMTGAATSFGQGINTLITK
jgi:PAX-interacting protein 1